MAGEEQRDCGDCTTGGDRPRADGVDRVLGKVGALAFRALPGIASERAGTDPVLKLLRGRHEACARAFHLDPRRRDLGLVWLRRIHHSALRIRPMAIQIIAPAIAASSSMPTRPARSGPTNLASARTLPTASALSAAMPMNRAATSRPAGMARALALAVAMALTRPTSARA